MKYHIEVYRRDESSKVLLRCLTLDANKHFIDGEEIGEQIEEVILQDIEAKMEAQS